MLASLAPAASAVTVRVERCVARGDSVEIALDLRVAAPPSVVWGVITDYDRMSRFVPGLEKSHRLSRTSEGPVVEQIGIARVAFVGRRVSALLQMREQGPYALGYRALAGSFPRLDGRWVLQPLPEGGTRLRHVCRVWTRTGLPDAMVGWIVRSELTPRARAIGREAERRAAPTKRTRGARGSG